MRVEHGWVEVGERVFCRRYQPWDVTIGAVVSSHGVQVVDTRASPRQAGELLDDLGRLGRCPPRWVVNTHWHFDHTFGNARFVPAELWGHRSLPGVLLARAGEAPGPLAVARVRPRRRGGPGL